MNSRFPVVNNLYSIHFTPSHTITTTQCKEHEHKWSICISGCKFHSNEKQQMDLMDHFVLQQGGHGHTLVVHNRIQLHVHNYTHMHTHTEQSQVAIYYKIGNTSQNNDPQQGRNSCLWLSILVWDDWGRDH